MDYPRISRSATTSTPLTKAATYAGMTGPRNNRFRRRLLYDGDGDPELQQLDRHNNNSNTAINVTTTSLVDELEQLRTDNFQLRLRVYNAERRVDRLSAAQERNTQKRDDSSSGSDCDTSTGGSDSTADDGVRDDETPASRDDQATAAAKAKATAEAAVRTIHDLLTVNRRLLALLAATVSAKAVAVSADDKRRWQRLRNHIDKYSGEQDYNAEKNEGTRQDSSNESDSSTTSTTTTTDSETCMTRLSAERVATTSNKHPAPPSPPPAVPQPRSELPPADDDGPGSELARLRARCRRLERSLQQLVNTELWARNRQIGKLEQQRYVTQVADAAALKERQQVIAAAAASEQARSRVSPTVISPAATKGILVKRSPATGTKTPPAVEVATATSTSVAITTPPPVLPDYSEVNFFFSCDEIDEDDSESNTLSSAEEDTEESDDVEEEEPVRLLPVAGHALRRSAAVVATSTPVTGPPVVRPRKRQRRKGGAVQVAAQTASSSSTESVPMTGDGGVTTTTTTSPTLSRRLHQRRRRRRRRTSSGPERYSMCGRCGGGIKDGPSTTIDTATRMADAQVQCGVPDNGAAADSSKVNDQLLLLRRELDARRRENSRLYDMLLRLQRGRGYGNGDDGNADGPNPTPPDPDDVAVDSNSDRAGSPEPYRRAARVVRGRIADLLPPLLSSRSTSVAPAADVQRGPNELSLSGSTGEQQQQLLLLSRLRERIVAYERQELVGGDDNGRRRSVSSSAVAAAAAVTDSEDAIRHMDRAALVNVALPRAVDRLRRALVPLLQQPDESAPTDRAEELPLDRRTLVQPSGAGDDDDRRR